MEVHAACSTPEVRAALDRADLIGAIKLLRELTGCGLPEAKQAIDVQLAAARPDEPLAMAARRQELEHWAWELVNQSRDGRLDAAEVLPRLAAAVPGFSADQYHSAVSEAWRASL